MFYIQLCTAFKQEAVGKLQTDNRSSCPWSKSSINSRFIYCCVLAVSQMKKPSYRNLNNAMRSEVKMYYGCILMKKPGTVQPV